jgi:hypothetical protein
MDSGGGTGVDTPAGREPDVLDMWFACRRRTWWRQWRWPVGLIFAVALALIVARIWWLLTANFHLDVFVPRSIWLYRLYANSVYYSINFNVYLYSLLTLIAVVIAAMWINTLQVPDDIRVAVPDLRTKALQRRAAHRITWCLVIWLGIVPQLALLASYLHIAIGVGYATPVLINSLIELLVILLSAELAIWLMVANASPAAGGRRCCTVRHRRLVWQIACTNTSRAIFGRHNNSLQSAAVAGSRGGICGRSDSVIVMNARALRYS